MNTNSEVKKTRDPSQSVGARRLRRFTARMVLDVRELQAWGTLKRPQGRAPFALHDSTSAFGMNTSPEERLFALLALSTSRERGLIASRSDAPTVAVDLSHGWPHPMRRVAERRLSLARYFQSSLHEEGSLGALNRGLKATATITKSLRDSGTAQGKKANPLQQLIPD